MNRMQVMMKRFGIITEKVAIHPVEALGYVVQSNNQEMVREKKNVLVLFDFDDVLNKTTEGKNILIEEMDAYIKAHNSTLSPEDTKDMVSSVETFSSWKDGDMKKDIAHPQAQLMAMQYLLDTVRHNSGDSGATLQEGLRVLDRIKKQQTHNEATYQEGDPFRFTPQGTLTKLQDKHVWDKELEDIYLHSFFGPLPVADMISEMRSMHELGIAVGIFTTGDPTGQIMRVCELFKANGHLPVDALWLSKGDKGTLLKDLATDGHMPQVDTIIVIDDNPDVLDSVIAVNETIKGPTIAGVRYRLPGGYAEQKQWKARDPNIQIDVPEAISLGGFVGLIQSIHQKIQTK